MNQSKSVPANVPSNSPLDYWEPKILKYRAEEWSKAFTPFGKFISSYLAQPSHFLELGVGAGQDTLGFLARGHSVVGADLSAVAFDDIRSGAPPGTNEKLQLKVVDVTKPFELPSSTFDVVYAQLVLHYFDNDTMSRAIKEIYRVLKPGGLFACMVNSESDPEFDRAKVNSRGLIAFNGIEKRYFTVNSLAPFVRDFELVELSDRGETPKDALVGTSRMIRFVGRKAKE